MRSIHRRANRRGLTLLEIMLAVTIIGMLATLAAPGIKEATRATRVMSTASDLRQYSNAFQTYNLANGVYPEDTLPGEMPPNMDGIMPFQFVNETPIGGQWDWDLGQFSTEAAVSIYNDRPTLEDSYIWSRLDRALDDGFLGSGRLRIRSNGIMYVIEEKDGVVTDT